MLLNVGDILEVAGGVETDVHRQQGRVVQEQQRPKRRRSNHKPAPEMASAATLRPRHPMLQSACQQSGDQQKQTQLRPAFPQSRAGSFQSVQFVALAKLRAG